MAFVFDFTNNIIEITEPQTEVVIQDLINSIREAEASEEGIHYGQIATASGKEVLGEGVAVGITVKLLGNWQLHFWVGNYIAKVSGGNLVGGPGDDPIAYTEGVQVLLLQSAAATIVTSDGSAAFTKDDVTEAVWDADRLSHNFSGSFGEACQGLTGEIETELQEHRKATEESEFLLKPRS